MKLRTIVQNLLKKIQVNENPSYFVCEGRANPAARNAGLSPMRRQQIVCVKWGKKLRTGKVVLEDQERSREQRGINAMTIWATIPNFM